MHSIDQPIHNLKKFSVLMRFKFTRDVQKYLEAKILPGRLNYRMQFGVF